MYFYCNNSGITIVLFLYIFQISPGAKPPKREKKEAPVVEIPILRLTQFTHSPKICFDKVKIGESKTLILKVLNPKDDPQTVRYICFYLASQN